MIPCSPKIIGGYASETPFLNNSSPREELRRRKRMFFENVKISILLIPLIKNW